MSGRSWVWLVTALSVAVSACGGSGDQVVPDTVSSPELAKYVAARQAEVDRVIVECLRRFGVAAEVAEGGVEVFGAVDQGRLEALLEACEHEAIEVGVLEPEPTDPEAFYRELYAFYLTVKECLEGEGYQVPEPPSLEAFVESAGSVWYPYDLVPVSRQEKLKETRCPDTWRAW